MLEPRLSLGVPAQERGVVLARRHALLEGAQLGLDGREVGGAGEHVVTERAARLIGRALVMQRDARAFLPRQLAALERDLARERPQQRRLSGAVRPGQGEPVAALDLERDAVEEDVARKFLAERGCNKDCLGCKLSFCLYAVRSARRQLALLL